MLKSWWEMWKLSFRRNQHGEVEYHEFEETTGSAHGGTNNGTNSRRTSAGGEDCNAVTTSPVSPDDRSAVVGERLRGV